MGGDSGKGGARGALLNAQEGKMGKGRYRAVKDRGEN